MRYFLVTLPPSLGLVTVLCLGPQPGRAQYLLRPIDSAERVHLLPSDLATLESSEARKDLPCAVTPRKPEVGFDLRFHAGYDVTIPMRELEGSEELLTIVFRAYPDNDKSRAAYFTQHIRVPAIEADAKGDATLQGGLDLGEGNYHVDWLMRDRAERLCSTSWDFNATLSPKDKPMSLFIRPGAMEQSVAEPFIEDPAEIRNKAADDALSVKILVNFAPQSSDSAALQRSDTDALVSILREIELDPHMHNLSLVAFNMQERKVVYRQDGVEKIDFPALGKALQTLKLGTVDLQRLSEKHGETNFLQDLIEKEVGQNAQPDAVIFAGPKAMLTADVPQDELRRIGEVECPVFYMNYNPNPQAVPWKDSISHAIRVFKGTEYTISRPRDLWFSTSEMLTRIVRAKRQRTLSALSPAGSK